MKKTFSKENTGRKSGTRGKPEKKAFRKGKDFEKEKSSGPEKKYFSRDGSKKSDSYGKPFTRSAKKFKDNKEEKDGKWEKKPFKKRSETFRKKGATKPAKISEDIPGSSRLNKFIANAGICSRREADDLITAGVISINGKVVTQLGIKVMDGDEVKFHDKIISGEKKIYLLLNKPKDYITTTDDPFERKTVMALIKTACKERIYPVGRLDRATTGILLFTNDGDMAKKLTHPSHNIRKIYHVGLDKAIKKVDFDKVIDGLELEDGKIFVDAISYADDGKDKAELIVEIHSGRNRIVRRIFESLGYGIRKLDRVSFAGLTKKDLMRGKWRFLSEKEVGYLKMQSGK